MVMLPTLLGSNRVLTTVLMTIEMTKLNKHATQNKNALSTHCCSRIAA